MAATEKNIVTKKKKEVLTQLLKEREGERGMGEEN